MFAFDLVVGDFRVGCERSRAREAQFIFMIWRASILSCRHMIISVPHAGSFKRHSARPLVHLHDIKCMVAKVHDSLKHNSRQPVFLRWTEQLRINEQFFVSFRPCIRALNCFCVRLISEFINVPSRLVECRMWFLAISR